MTDSTLTRREIAAQEAYDTCSILFNESCNRPIEEGEKREFVLITLCDKEDAMESSACMLSTAGSPKDRFSREDYDKMAPIQQCALLIMNSIGDVVQAQIKHYITAQSSMELLSVTIEDLRKLMAGCEDREEFEEKMREMLVHKGLLSIIEDDS